MDNQKIFVKATQNLAKLRFSARSTEIQEKFFRKTRKEHQEKPRNPKKMNHLEYNKSV